MKNALQSVPASDFTRPQGLLEVNIDPTTGLLATDNCPRVQREFYKIGTEPTRECADHASTGGNKQKPKETTDGYKQKLWNWIRGGSR
jgi:membrane carboxypeptidase/penicillin-binding protein